MISSSSIPARVEDITASWLSSVLGTTFDGLVVREVDVSPVGTGQTAATYRIRATYADGHGNGKLPESFIVKIPSQDQAVRGRVALSYRSEFAFYTEVMHSVSAPVPQCYHCEIANDGTDFVLLLADMDPAVQGDQIRGCTDAEAQLAVAALAGLHGPRWCDPAWLEFTGTVFPIPDQESAKGLGDIARIAIDTTLERLGSRMSEDDRQTLIESGALMDKWLLAEPRRFSLLHGDYRLDNLLYGPARTEVTVVDWQTLGVGLPARDLAYFTATSLLPEDRARAERGLVETYHNALVSHGVSGYDLDTCWRDYKLAMLQVPLVTTLGHAFSAATERGDEMALVMLERGGRATRELKTLETIRAFEAAE